MIKYRALCSAAILGLVATLFAGCGDGDNTLTKICNPSEAACSNDGNSGQVCNADGTRLVDFSCSDGEVCTDGACVGQCDPSAQRCASEAAAQVCSEDGKQWIPVPCSPGTACEGDSGCVPTEEGVIICEPADAVCGDERTAKICDADGSAWIFITCEADEHCVEGACEFNDESACAPRETQCVGGNSAKCNDDGDGWEITECPDSAPCLDGVCTGISCVPGTTKCADQPVAPEVYSQPWAGYDFGAIYTCNAAGDGWELTHCSLGEYCIYDHISDDEINEYMGGMSDWWYGYGGLPQMDLSDSVASCQEPGCLMPHQFRRVLSDIGWGNLDSSVASSFCGTPDMPGAPGSDSDVYTQCEGLPPFQNLGWVSYECQDFETCAVDSIGDYDSAYCSSECTPGTVTCFSDDSLQICQEDGTWGPPELCEVDAEFGYEYQCDYVTDFQGGMTAACMDPTCKYWLDLSGTGVIYEGYGACTPDGQYRPCEQGDAGDPIVLGEAEDCEGVCLEASDSGVIGTPTNTADQDPGSCGFECEDGQTQCLHDETTGSPLYRTCVNGAWSGVVESCGDNIVCWDGGGVYDLEYGMFYFATGDFLTEVKCGGECNPGAVVCNGDQTMECDDDGHWQDPEDCDLGVCEDHATYVTCEAECIPGTLSCTGDGNDPPNAFPTGFEYLCGDDGRWGTGTECDISDPERLQSCRVDSAGFVLGCVQCIGSNNAAQVADSQCRYALPDDLLPTEVRQCNAQNEWEDDVACEAGDTCVAGPTGPTAWCATVPLAE